MNTFRTIIAATITGSALAIGALGFSAPASAATMAELCVQQPGLYAQRRLGCLQRQEARRRPRPDLQGLRRRRQARRNDDRDRLRVLQPESPRVHAAGQVRTVSDFGALSHADRDLARRNHQFCASGEDHSGQVVHTTPWESHHERTRRRRPRPRGRRRGDRAALAEIYDRYADRLFDFSVGMLRDRDAAADCVQDVFVTAATKLGQLREADRCVRGSTPSPARHAWPGSAHANANNRPRNCPTCPAVTTPPKRWLSVADLAELVRAASAGLSDRDQVVAGTHLPAGAGGPGTRRRAGGHPPQRQHARWKGCATPSLARSARCSSPVRCGHPRSARKWLRCWRIGTVSSPC